MSCNCGGNDYNISIGNNGNCEPSTPEYHISLGGVGVNGYSPVVNFVNRTEQSFSIEVSDINGIRVSEPVPLLSYVSDQIDNINTTIANLGDTYLNKDGSNASSNIIINNLPIRTYSGGGSRLGDGGSLYSLAVQSKDIRLQNYDSTNSLLASMQLSNGNINIITNGIARYNSYEIATVNNIPTKTSDLTNDSGFITSSDLPTVGNGTITLTQGGVTKGTFTTNQSGNTTIELDAGGVTNPLVVQSSNTDGYTEIYGQNAHSFDTNSGGTFVTKWSDTVDGVEHSYTKTLLLSNGGRYGTKPNIQYNYKDEASGAGTSSITSLGFLNIDVTGKGTNFPRAVGGGYVIDLRIDNDTLKFTSNGTLYADISAPTYTAGTGIDITNDAISVDNTVAMKTDIPTVNNPTITFTQGGVTKGTITLNQSTNQTIALDAGGSGGGAVDSVNGQTGDVVLDASDVGALPDTTVIPIKTSDLTNDSGYITASALNGYATQTWVGQQGYLTSSDLTNYVTNSTLSTTLADYQPLLVSGTNIKTINNASLLGSGNITVLANTASNNTSLTVGGTASTRAYTTNVGIGSEASASAAQAFGHYAIASGQYSLALGQGAEASNSYSIQIGKGTNSTARSLMIGFGSTGNYELLDGSTGLIPDARISTNIARTSQIPTNNNQLTNGAGYITNSALNGYAKTVDLATVATSGSYNDLTNKPTIPAAQVQADWNVTNTSSMAYIKNKPSIPSAVTESTVSGWGFTKNTGTVTSVNNVSPVNGNVTLSIPSTDNLANKSLSNLSTTGQAVIDGKVSKSGDTMTGALNINVDTQNQLVLVNPYITKGTNPSERKYYGLYFNDSRNLSADNWKDTRLGGIETSVQKNGTVTTSIQAVQNVANNTATSAGLNLNMTSNGVASCSFPDTTCVDGQWQFINTVIMDNVSVKSSSNLTYTLSDIPNDGHMYEVMLTGNIETGTTNGNVCVLQLRSDFSTGAVARICSARTRSSSSMQAQGTVIIPLTSSRKIYVSRNSGWEGKANLWLIGYRRIGTNS